MEDALQLATREKALFALSRMRDEIYALGDAFFAYPELGYTEWETKRLASDWLRAASIPFEDDIALTGLRATLGDGGYHIAVVADMDAVLVSRGEESMPYHSCGHHIQMAVGLGVMRALRESGVMEDMPGRISLFLTPAEEFIDLETRARLQSEGKIRFFSGKQEMIARGAFDDVDCVLSLHVGGEAGYRFDVGSTLTGFAVKKACFLGKAAHAGALAHEGKNALHGAALLLQACAFLADRYPHAAGLQLHPIVTQGGASMNVVPERAVVETYVRANATETLLDACAAFDAAAKHCAAALGLDCTVETTPGYLPLRPSPELGDVLLDQMTPICGKDAIAIGLASGASGDVGDLSALLPTAQFGFTGFSGRIHSDTFAVTDPEHVYLNTGRVLIGACLRVLGDPNARPSRVDFAARKTAYLTGWLEALRP